MSIVEVARDKGGGRDVFRAYQVLIDEQVVGRLRRGKTGRFDVPAGRHGVRIKIDWTGSPTVLVDLAEDQVVRLRCRPSRGAFFGLIDMFGRDRWVGLEVVGQTGPGQ